MIQFKEKTINIILIIATISIMVLIFNLSSQIAKESNELSKGITRFIVNIMEKTANKSDFKISTLNHIIRKSAHFSAYLVLSVLVMSLIRRNGIYGFKGIILSLGICILYAISDEVHQLFVPGRGGQIKDVLIDSFGAISGVFIYKIIYRIKKKSYS